MHCKSCIAYTLDAQNTTRRINEQAKQSLKVEEKKPVYYK
jgi:hypothetical protein